MDFYRLDKVDKIGISIIFIIFTFFSIFDLVCFGAEVSFDTIKGRAVSSSTIVDSATQSLAYASLKKGHTYKFTNNYQYAYQLFKGDSIEVGSSVSVIFNQNSVPYGSSITFVAENDYFIGYFTNNSALGNTQTLEDITPPGLDSAVADLVGNVGISSIWDIFNTAIPYVLIVVIVALGMYLIFRMIKGLSKGKGRV